MLTKKPTFTYDLCEKASFYGRNNGSYFSYTCSFVARFVCIPRREYCTALGRFHNANLYRLKISSCSGRADMFGCVEGRIDEVYGR